jgi:hypothetical protein
VIALPPFSLVLAPDLSPLSTSASCSPSACSSTPAVLQHLAPLLHLLPFSTPFIFVTRALIADLLFCLSPRFQLRELLPPLHLRQLLRILQALAVRSQPPPLPPTPPPFHRPSPLIRLDMRLHFRSVSSLCCLAHVPHPLLIPCAQVAYKRCDSTIAGGCTGSNAITDLAKREAQPKCMYASLLQHTLAQTAARLLFGACVYLTLSFAQPA